MINSRNYLLESMVSKRTFVFYIIKNESKQNLMSNKDQNVCPSGNVAYKNPHTLPL